MRSRASRGRRPPRVGPPVDPDTARARGRRRRSAGGGPPGPAPGGAGGRSAPGTGGGRAAAGRPPRAAPCHVVEARVRRDAVQPGAERPPPLAREPRPRPPGTYERLLHEVFGVLERPDHAVAVRP